MSETKHTPGPWEWHNMGGYHVLRQKDNDDYEAYVADDGSAGGEYSPAIDVKSADAKLMAAAPAMLEALKDTLKRIEQSDHWWMDSPYKGGMDADMIRAAIRQAEEEK